MHTDRERLQLWKPSPDRIKNANLTAFLAAIQREEKVSFGEYHDLYSWSVNNPEKFWAAVWKFCKIRSTRGYEAVLKDGKKMPGAKWFVGSELNYAANLLRHQGSKPAIVFWGEGQVRRTISFSDVSSSASRLAKSLREIGIRPGDRVAGFMPNMPETIISMLAAASVGAVWSSCSPDFGVSGVVDRFGQIAPKVLFTADGYFHKGERFDSLVKVRDIVKEIPSVEKVIVVPYVKQNPDISNVSRAIHFSDFISRSDEPPVFEPLPFDHPLFIMFSSGTTGRPKCIIHGAGGTLIEHLKELVLHTDLKDSDRIFYQTTCGWMMWNWLVTGLATGATLVLYDGAPFQRDGKILFDLAQDEKVTIFGTNAKYLAALEKSGVKARETHDLSALHTMLSTGSPLLPESFDYVYRDIKDDICLSSISGGTDIIGCFALGCPLIQVHREELQGRSLGLKVEVYDEHGNSVTGKKGELVCTAPFPSMPLYFWDDPDGRKYKEAYFSKYPGVWHHGDYVELTEHQGMIFYGRSDAVLNPGGIRIGTAEVYRQVEKLSEIEESICIGQEWQGDTRVVLFVKLKGGEKLDENLKDKIRKQIRANATPFHVPKKIIQVPDIPRTRSGKIVELAVRDVIHGREIKNMEALMNPEALEYFRGIQDLDTE